MLLSGYTLGMFSNDRINLDEQTEFNPQLIPSLSFEMDSFCVVLDVYLEFHLARNILK